MQWPPYFDSSLRRRLSSLKWRLLGLLLASIALTLTLVGIALALLISDFHEDAAQRRFAETFRVLEERLSHTRVNLSKTVRNLARREDIVSSLNMLQHYATSQDYDQSVFDPEKRALTRVLQNAADAAGIGQLAAYTADGRLVAFYAAHSEIGYVSNGKGRSTIFGQHGESHGWREAERPRSVSAIVQGAAPKFVAKREAEGFSVEFLALIYRRYPDGKQEHVGYLAGTDFIGRRFALDLASRTGTDFGIVFSNGQRIGGLDQVEFSVGRKTNSEIRQFPASNIFSDPDYFLVASRYPLAQGKQAYFVGSLPKTRVKAEIHRTQSVVMVVLFVAAFVMVPVGATAVSRTISRPLKQLMSGAGAIQRGEYQMPVKLHRQDELGALAEAFNQMADTIHRREQALAESEYTYRTLVDNLPQRIFLKDSNLEYVSANRQFAHDVALSKEAIHGKDDFDLYPKDLAEKYRADDRRIMETGRIEEFEEKYVAGGRELTIQTVKTPLYDAAGRSKGVLGIFWDISARKEADEKLRQSAAVFESTAEGVMITDANGTITAVNRAFTEITGFAEAEVLGANPRIRKSHRQDDAFYKNLWKALETEGRWQGEIWNRRKNGEVYAEWMTISSVRNSAGEISHYVAVFSDISAIKQSEEELNRLAYHDPLTELPNRALMGDRLAHAIGRAQRTGTKVAVLFLDLDRFKNVNDTLGHPVGDVLLKKVAGRLRETLRQDDTVARLGGDEFVIILEEVHDVIPVESVATKLLELFSDAFLVRGHELYIGCSIGISIYPNDGTNVAALIKNADAAMYRAKEHGRHNFQFYTHELTSHVAERLALESALRHALERGEFQLHFQPQVTLPSGAVTGAEALLRWNHPQLGMVSPDKFIPLAEESGLIVPIGNWVLEAACAQASHWIKAGLPLEYISVNVSGVQIHRGDIVTSVRQVLGETGLQPSQLELEITESAIMKQSEDSIEVLDELRQLGLRLAVDDFGTGYSSLSYLKRFPITNLKIDKSFVRDIPQDVNDEFITKAIIALARSLQLDVTAEGVETAEQRQFLEKQGCGRAQGYYFSKALSTAQFENYLSEQLRRGCRA